MEQFAPWEQTGTTLNAIFDSPAFEDAFTYEGEDLGFTYTPEKTTWKFWSPFATLVELCVYTTGSDEEEGAARIHVTPMELLEKGVWSLTREADYKGVYYTYRVHFGDTSFEICDPYARSTGLNGARSLVFPLANTSPLIHCQNPYNYKGKMRDAVVWEMHVADFSGEGTYLSFCAAEKIAYLKRLGITHVELMPVFDFATMAEIREEGTDRAYNWGYDPRNYNAPSGVFSTDPYHGEVRVKELKTLIAALHAAGIGVIMDVVYNHVYKVEESFLHKAFPFYYFRLKDGRGEEKFVDGSGCGNELATERSMVRRFIVQSVNYWAAEYQLDGFRFDLMGLIDVDTMNLIRKTLKEKHPGHRFLLYGEPWSAAASAVRKPANKENMGLLDPGIGFFDDMGRDALRGNNFNASAAGFLAGAGFSREIMEMAYGAPDYSRAVHYASCHDNLTLWDKLAASFGPEASREELLAANKMSAAAILLSPGMAFMLGGEELGRSKGGDGNSYKSPRSVNALDWSLAETNRDLLAYYQGLIRIRQTFRNMDAFMGSRPLLVEDTLVAWLEEFEDSELIIALNASAEGRDVAVPEGLWSIVAEKDYADAIPRRFEGDGALWVEPHAALVAWRHK